MQSAAAGSNGADDQVELPVDEFAEQILGKAEPTPQSNPGGDALGQSWERASRHELGRSAQAQCPAVQGSLTAQVGRDAGQYVQWSIETLGQVFPRSGGHDAAGLAHEEGLAHRSLQRLQLGGDRGLGQPQQPGRRSQRSCPVDSLERPEQIQRDLSLPHRPQAAIDILIASCCLICWSSIRGEITMGVPELPDAPRAQE